MKHIIYGVILHKGAYWRNGWLIVRRKIKQKKKRKDEENEEKKKESKKDFV